MFAITRNEFEITVGKITVALGFLLIVLICSDMYVRTDEHGLLPAQIFMKERIEKAIGFRTVKVKMIHAILPAAYLRLVMRKGQRMCRHVNFRNHIHAIGHAQALQVSKLLLGIGSVLGRQPGKAVTLQAEGGIGAVPVVAIKLWEAVIIEMHLQLIHLIKGQYLDTLPQILHRKELTAHIEHKSAMGKARIITRLALGQAIGLPAKHLQKGTCGPEHALGLRRRKRDTPVHRQHIALTTQRTVGGGKRQIHAPSLRAPHAHRVIPLHERLQIVSQNPGR